MPYIENEARRAELDQHMDAENAGELTYCLTRVVMRFLPTKSSFLTYCIAIGALVCTILELYRRRVARYEDLKRKQNGDVYE